VGLGPVPDLRLEIGRQGVERPCDDTCLLEVDRAGEQPGAHAVPPLERRGDPAGADRGAVAAPGVVGEPGRRTAGSVVQRHVAGDGQHAQHEPVEPVGRPGQLEEGLRLLRGRHQHRVRRRGLVHRGVHAPGARQQQVVGRERELFHVSTLGVTTDSFEHPFEAVGNALRTTGCGRETARPDSCGRVPRRAVSSDRPRTWSGRRKK